MKHKRWLFILAAVLLLACDADEKYNSHYPCNFVFHTDLFPASALTYSLSSGGMFVIVKPTVKEGVVHLMLTPNVGTWEKSQTDLVMSTAIANEKLSYQDMGARQSLIIGCCNVPDLSGNRLRAFDAQCPNCLEENDTKNYPLTFDDDKTQPGVTCAKCHRIYLLESEGMSMNGKKDTPLYQYRISYSVNYNNEHVLKVQN